MKNMKYKIKLAVFTKKILNEIFFIDGMAFKSLESPVFFK